MWKMNGIILGKQFVKLLMVKEESKDYSKEY